MNVSNDTQTPYISQHKPLEAVRYSTQTCVELIDHRQEEIPASSAKLLIRLLSKPECYSDKQQKHIGLDPKPAVS